MFGHGAHVDAHADSADFRLASRGIDPHAGQARDRFASNAIVSQGADDDGFQIAHVTGDIGAQCFRTGQLDDRVGDKLPRTVIGDVAAAIHTQHVDAALCQLIGCQPQMFVVAG